MKRVLAILLLVPFIMVLAPPCHAAGKGEVAVSLVDVSSELQERSVLITLGNGPNDTDAVFIVLNGLNQYSQTVTLPEGIYYCNAAVQYDALNDWPLREVDGTTFLQVESGGQYELQYEFAGESWFTERLIICRRAAPINLFGWSMRLNHLPRRIPSTSKMKPPFRRIAERLRNLIKWGFHWVLNLKR